MTLRVGARALIVREVFRSQAGRHLSAARACQNHAKCAESAKSQNAGRRRRGDREGRGTTCQRLAAPDKVHDLGLVAFADLGWVPNAARFRLRGADGYALGVDPELRGGR
jgi:hypothetical protein